MAILPSVQRSRDISICDDQSAVLACLQHTSLSLFRSQPLLSLATHIAGRICAVPYPRNLMSLHRDENPSSRLPPPFRHPQCRSTLTLQLAFTSKSPMPFPSSRFCCEVGITDGLVNTVIPSLSPYMLFWPFPLSHLPTQLWLAF